jgi:hypothetical protein
MLVAGKRQWEKKRALLFNFSSKNVKKGGKPVMRTLIPNLEKNYLIASTAFQQTLGRQMKSVRAASKKHQTNPFIIEGNFLPFHPSSKKSLRSSRMLKLQFSIA